MLKNRKILFFWVVLALVVFPAENVFPWSVVDMNASPLSVPADGVSTATIETTLVCVEWGEPPVPGTIEIGDFYLISYVCGTFTESNTFFIHRMDTEWSLSDGWYVSEIVGHLSSNTPGWAWVYSLSTYMEGEGRQDLEIIYFYNLEITSPESFPAYVKVQDHLSIETKINPYPSQATYNWMKVSGPGNVFFTAASSPNTDFFADTAGTYEIKCECLVEGAEECYAVTKQINVFDFEITSPVASPAYVKVDDNISVETTMNTSYPATYSWTKLSGPGNVTFSAASSANTDFSADTAGAYEIQCECLVDGAEESCMVTKEIYVVAVEFFESGTETPLDHIDIGTDGTSTLYDCEYKLFTIKVTPHETYHEAILECVVDNSQVSINPTFAVGTYSESITATGDGTEDAILTVKKGDYVFATLTIEVHKPDSISTSPDNNYPLLIPPAPGDIGVGYEYRYNIKDINGRIIDDLGGYVLYERMHFDQNSDGFSGKWNSDVPAGMVTTPITGPKIFLPMENAFIDTVGTFVGIYTKVVYEENTECLDADAIFQWHNSWYVMDIYLKNSTKRYTWTPVLGTTYVAYLEFNHTDLEDNARVTIFDDQID
ncbi:MAG: hypothetical protein V1747_11170 [Candidatus Omnitrophota bacterium]